MKGLNWFLRARQETIKHKGVCTLYPQGQRGGSANQGAGSQLALAHPQVVPSPHFLLPSHPTWFSYSSRFRPVSVRRPWCKVAKSHHFNLSHRQSIISENLESGLERIVNSTEARAAREAGGGVRKRLRHQGDQRANPFAPPPAEALGK